MGSSINGGAPKWMVYNGQSQSKMDDLGVPPYDLGNTHVLNRAKPNAINNSMGFPGSPSRDGDKKAFF